MRSGLSVASSPLLRTTHVIGNLVCVDASRSLVEVHTSWTCHAWSPKRQTQHVFFGRYEHRLESVNGQWLIARKKIILMNDRIPTMIDFYCL